MRLVYACALLPLVVAPAFAREKHPHPVGAAAAAVAPREAAPQANAAANPPGPGECVYGQPGVKLCTALLDGQGAFDVYTFTPAVVYVRTEEPIVNVIPPDPHYFQTDRRDNSVVIVPTRDKLPERTPAVITTKSLTVTLNVRPGSRDRVDTQLTVLDPMRNRRNAQIAEAVAALEPKLVEKINGELVDGLAREGAEIRPVRGKTVGRNAELIVLRALEVLRVGTRRYLFFSIDNRSGDPFQVRDVHLAVGQRDERALWRMATSSIAAGSEGRGVIELTAHRGSRMKLRVDEVDPRRAIELPRLEAP